jgi:hypothetical protein
VSLDIYTTLTTEKMGVGAMIRIESCKEARWIVDAKAGTNDVDNDEGDRIERERKEGGKTHSRRAQSVALGRPPKQSEASVHPVKAGEMRCAISNRIS